MKIEFEIQTSEDAARAAAVLDGIAGALAADAEAAPGTPLPGATPGAAPAATKRSPGRPRKSQVDPAAAYVAAGGILPPGSVAEPGVTASAAAAVSALADAAAAAALCEPEPAAVVEPEPEPAAVVEPEPEPAAVVEPAASPEELRAKLRTMAQQKGVIWFREILTANQAASFSALSDAAVAAILATA